VTRPGGIGPVDTGRRVPLRIVDDTDRPDAAPGDAMVLTRQREDCAACRGTGLRGAP